ncbi:YjgB family protein [Clostridium sp. AL.422]|uniref:YjgB family protein n=1 Tax=Clostridium TaxID=1485 RepID=UPI00293DA92D|nr:MULTISPECIES: YjgB family protein [unclassified Clostridium]MDV4149575.1 YjgB family protein [Clostridium sp. AL.422]
MKKKILIAAIMVVFAISITSCGYKDKSNNNEINVSKPTEIEEGASGDSSNNTPHKNTEPNTDDSDETNAGNSDNYKFDLLNSIKGKSEDGMIINSEFKAKYTVIDEIINVYGKADSENYIAEAKGIYYAFESKNLAFGCNKGSQIFEVRSFDKSLKELNLQDIISYFGEPSYEVTTSLNERIIGYVVNDDFKLLFVFSDSKSEKAILDHYSVLYPRGTINNMAGDPGREW